MKAYKYLIRSFFNSLARDYNIEIVGNSLSVKLIKDELLQVKIESASLLGNHFYTGEILLINSKKIAREIDYKTAVSIICKEYIGLAKDSEFEMYAVMSFEYSLKLQNELRGKDYSDTYLESEQQLLYGHPIHPYPKARIGFSCEDISKYTPEYQGEFPIIWVAVHESVCIIKTISKNYSEFTKICEFDYQGSFEDDYQILPFHPWQFQHLKESECIKTYLNEGKIIYLREGCRKWSASSSIRSIYNKEAPYFPKFSMSLKITNSVRHLTENEAKRGLEVSRVLSTIDTKKYTNFTILEEPGYFTLLDKDGNSINESICVLRENKMYKADNPYLLSYLTQETHLYDDLVKISLQSQKSLRLVQKNWFDSFLNFVVTPILSLASCEGILLGAHMQNLILDIKDGVIKGCIFKDCQGTGYTSLGFEKFNAIGNLEIKNGNVIDEDNVNKIFLYYIFVNTTLSVISALSNSHNEDEIYLMNLLRNHLYELSLKDSNVDKSIFNFLLTSKYIYQKSNFKCGVNSFNENTMSDPSQIYNKMKNPLVSEEFSLRQIESKRSGLLKSKKVSFLNHEISIRSVDAKADLDIFWKWQNKEYVSHFWEMNYSKTELLKYLVETVNSPYKEPVIFQVAGQPVGYFELYWAYDDRIAPYCDASKFDRGIHLLFGEEKYLATRYVPEGLVLAKEYMFDSCEQTQVIWGEPRFDNKNIMKLVRFLPGWEFVREFDFPHKTAALIKCTRENFYKDLMGWKK